MTFEDIVRRQADRRADLEAFVLDGADCVTLFRGAIPETTITYRDGTLYSHDWRPFITTVASLGKAATVHTSASALVVEMDGAAFTVKLRFVPDLGFEVHVSDVVPVEEAMAV